MLSETEDYIVWMDVTLMVGVAIAAMLWLLAEAI